MLHLVERGKGVQGEGGVFSRRRVPLLENNPLSPYGVWYISRKGKGISILQF